MQNLTLQLTDWMVAGFWPYTPSRRGAELNNLLDCQTGWISAQVPGSVYGDLERHGMIPSPYYEMNATACEWVSNRWWVYQSKFVLPAEYQEGTYKLVCGGIDYRAEIVFNGKTVGTHEGMFLPYEADVTSLVRHDGAVNEVTVILHSNPDEMGQIGYTSRTKTQRSRFYYKWDFSTRMVGVGLYEPVTLEYIPTATMTERQIETVKQADDSWTLSANVQIEAYKQTDLQLRLRLFDGQNQIGERVCDVFGQKRKQKVRLTLEDLHPQLWWPNGYGAQYLYILKIGLCQGDTLLQETEHPIGFRTAEYVQAGDRCDDSLPYQPVINGKRIYIKGVNMVPLDHRQGMVTTEDYRKFLTLCKDANIDLVRLWGGGVIERDSFYQICDELGILVWQEFIQSSSGLESTPSEDPGFLLLLSKVSGNAIKYIRNHPSILFFSGGNELFENGLPGTYCNKNIKMLRDLVDELDGHTMMLPTSASGPNEAIKLDKMGLNHDVHGPWKLYGPKMHYDLFNASDAILQSEFGCDGFSNYETLKKFLSPANLKVTTVAENIVWRFHGEWWDTYRDRELPIFGTFNEDDLEILVKCNQFMQAEGIRYGVEANRRRAFENCGSIIWQFNEPWPNVFCTCIVDYYGTPKMAYYEVAEAFAPRTAMLTYDNILQTAGSALDVGVSVANDLAETDFTTTVQFCDHNGVAFDTQTISGHVGENSIADAGKLTTTIPKTANKGIILNVTLCCGDETVSKRYVLLTKSAGDSYYDRAIAIAHYDYMVK